MLRRLWLARCHRLPLRSPPSWAGRRLSHVPSRLRQGDVTRTKGSLSRHRTALPPLGRPASSRASARTRRRLTSLRVQRLERAATWSSATPPRRRRCRWPSTCCVIHRWTSRGTPPLRLGCVTLRPSWTQHASRPYQGPPGPLRAEGQLRLPGPEPADARGRARRLLPARTARQGAPGPAARRQPPLHLPTRDAARLAVGKGRTFGRPWSGNAMFAAPPPPRRAPMPWARPQGRVWPRYR
jgi:hypothetical protein